ncbi:MAG: hypothetical protein KKF02_04985 [Proteobacteria bacterium]|nr:hypothetical protein [Pseudomonadota bacterium]
MTTCKMELTGIEGLLVALILLIVPFVLPAILMKLLPTWEKEELAIN